MNTDVLGVKLDRVADFEQATYRKITWRLIPFLLLCYVCSYLDRVNVGFAKLQMLNELKFSESVYGLGAGIFFIGYFIFEVPSNVILDRVGARKWIARIMITWGVLSAGMMFVNSELSFYIMRFLLGAAEAGFFPGIILYLTYWFPANRRGRATSLFLTALAISGIIGGPLSGWILRDFHGLQGWSGWQWLFLIEGIPSVLVGFWVLVYLDDRVKDAKWLSEDEKKLVAHNIAIEERTKVNTSVRNTLMNGRVWHLSALYFCLVISLYGVSFWLPSIIKGLGVKDALNVGLLSAIPWMSGVVAMVFTARSADRKNERRWHIAIPALIGAAGFFISVTLHANLVVSMLGLTIATMGILSSLPLFWSLPTAILGGTSAAAGIALINSLGNLSGFLGPYAVGMLKDATKSTDAGMYMLAVFLILAAMLTLLVPSRLVQSD